MKSGKKLAALTLALMVTLSACGGPGGGNGVKTPEAAIKASQEKMAAAKSMESNMLMDMELSADGQTIAVTTQMDMTYNADPVQMKIDLTIDMGELGNQTMSMYAQQSGEDFTLYAAVGDDWSAQTVSAADFQQYDSRSSMDLYLDSSSGFKADGTEKLAGGDADKYTGVIGGDSLQAVLEGSGALDSLSTIVGDTSGLSDLYKDLEDMPVSIWIDQASGYPVRYEMDMTSVMAKIMDKALTAAGADVGGLTVSKMSIIMDCSNYDNATAFTIPEEALAAAG